jgi:hypothetical protein
MPAFQVKPDPQADTTDPPYLGHLVPDLPASLAFFAANFSSASGFCHQNLLIILIDKHL